MATATCSVVVYALSGAAFAARTFGILFATVTESVVGTSWSLAGFDCEPLQGDPHYGVSYSYSEMLGEHRRAEFRDGGEFRLGLLLLSFL